MSPTSSCSAAATETKALRVSRFSPLFPTEADISPHFQELSCGVAHVRLQNRKLFARGVRQDRGGSFSCEVILSHGERDMTAAHGGMFGVLSGIRLHHAMFAGLITP